MDSHCTVGATPNLISALISEVCTYLPMHLRFLSTLMMTFMLRAVLRKFIFKSPVRHRFESNA